MQLTLAERLRRQSIVYLLVNFINRIEIMWRFYQKWTQLIGGITCFGNADSTDTRRQNISRGLTTSFLLISIANEYVEASANTSPKNEKKMSDEAVMAHFAAVSGVGPKPINGKSIHGVLAMVGCDQIGQNRVEEGEMSSQQPSSGNVFPEAAEQRINIATLAWMIQSRLVEIEKWLYI
jgi:hypothetical protein